MLTQEREQKIRAFMAKYHPMSRDCWLSAESINLLLGEIDRLRTENQELRSQLHCELCINTGELEDGRDCPRCKPDLSKALSLGK